MEWDGEDYQAGFDALAAAGQDVHGEADFVWGLAPRPTSVLDAGCGTGRVAIELARRGIDAVGVDRDRSMLATARQQAPSLLWVQADLAAFELGRRFDAVVMAGNVVLFTPAGTEAALVAGVARHVAPGGALVAGYQLGRGYGVEDYDAHVEAADVGLALESRFSTWDRARFAGDGDYVVSVHRR